MKLIILSISASLAQVPSIMLRYIPFRTETTKKQKKKLILIYSIVLLINSILFWHISNKGLLTVGYYKRDLFLLCILLAIINGIVIKKRHMEHIFVFGMTEILALLMLTMIAYAEAQIKSDDLELLIIVNSLSFCLLFLLLYPWLKRLMSNTVTPFFKTDNKDYWKNICLAPAAMFLAITLAFPMDQYIQTLTPTLCRMMISIASLCLCRGVSYDHELMCKREALSQSLNEQKEYYRALSNKIQETRKARHDLRHHLTVIYSCAEAGELPQIKEYCEELLHTGFSEAFVPFSGNSIIDGIIYHYMQLCRKEDIRFENQGFLLKETRISDTDLCCLLGNALENAYTACKKLESGRYIKLTIKEELDCLTISIENSFNGQLKKKQNHLLSLKRTSEPGIGLESMHDVCKKYHGDLIIQHTDSVFQVMCLLNLIDHSEFHGKEPHMRKWS